MLRPTSLAFALFVCAGAARAEAPASPSAKAAAAPAEKAQYATFVTSAGKIGVKLLPGEAPNTVANFVGLATAKKEWRDPLTGETKKAPYFDGLLFHRVIPGFMIQGGDPATRGAPLGAANQNGLPFGVSGPGYKFDDELPKAGGPPLFGAPCVLAMANAGPNTNGSQFFITEGAGAAVGQLEPRACDSKSGVCGYTRFGQGICGCDLVGKIARAGNSQTKLVKVTIGSEKPSCQ